MSEDGRGGRRDLLVGGCESFRRESRLVGGKSLYNSFLFIQVKARKRSAGVVHAILFRETTTRAKTVLS